MWAAEAFGEVGVEAGCADAGGDAVAVRCQLGVVLLEDVEPTGRAALEHEARRLTDQLDGTVIGTVYASRQMKQAKLP